MASTSPRWAPLPSGIGVMLRNARIDAGLSRDTLASALSMSTGVVQGLEEELRPPSVTVAARISETLGLDPWTDAVLQSVAVAESELRTRRGTRHTRPRRPRNSIETCAKDVPSPR
ncbi:helix-turn-helix domain-containing protein [Streptomyces pseudovenezuelae]|uniref:helix-turn-helix domain-containing protein n=1 Tax=Streptomyces pseudovenezuelae TaxID=67350 RepID=UPI0036EC0C2D